MAEEARQWRGTPLDMGDNLEPYGIKEIVIQYDSGNEDIFRPRQREEFGSYELHQISAYLEHIVPRLSNE